jgi:hypothetical protein
MAVSPVTVTITQDRLDEVLNVVREADRDEILVGYPEGSTRAEGGIGNAQLAYIHNNGAPAANIPARPFLEPGLINAQTDVAAIARSSLTRALDTGDTSAIVQGMHRMGHAAVGHVQRKISTGPFVPLKPATIRRKGSSTPLIDTGQMRAATTYVIRRKSGG